MRTREVPKYIIIADITSPPNNFLFLTKNLFSIGFIANIKNSNKGMRAYFNTSYIKYVLFRIKLSKGPKSLVSATENIKNSVVNNKQSDS